MPEAPHRTAFTPNSNMYLQRQPAACKGAGQVTQKDTLLPSNTPAGITVGLEQLQDTQADTPGYGTGRPSGAAHAHGQGNKTPKGGKGDHRAAGTFLLTLGTAREGACVQQDAGTGP